MDGERVARRPRLAGWYLRWEPLGASLSATSLGHGPCLCAANSIQQKTADKALPISGTYRLSPGPLQFGEQQWLASFRSLARKHDGVYQKADEGEQMRAYCSFQ